MDMTTKELADFKLVMQTISTIQTKTLTYEQRIHELQETYTVLAEHNIKVSN